MGLLEPVADILEDVLQVLQKLWDNITGEKPSYKKSRQDAPNHGRNHNKQNRRNHSENNTAISDTDMIKRLKILMSIPISSDNYPKEDLHAFLEKLWNDKVKASEAEAQRNEFTLYKGRLDLLKKYAKEKNQIRVKDSIESLLDSLNQNDC